MTTPTNTVIGGLKIGGGWINTSDQGPVPNGTAPWKISYQRGTPIRQCRLQHYFRDKPVNTAGLLGFPTSRRVTFQTRFAFTIWYDFNNPVEVSSTPGGGQASIPSLRQYQAFQTVFLLGYDPLKVEYFKAWYAPVSICDSITPIWDEESDPRQVIGEEITGHTRGWTFLLPDDGVPNDPTTICGAYVSYISNGIGAQLVLGY
jgi:hypothetical protein